MTKAQEKVITLYVASRIRAIRENQNMTQAELAKYLGISFQQVQKYENGTNRVSSARLLQISKVLKAPVTEFLPFI